MARLDLAWACFWLAFGLVWVGFGWIWLGFGLDLVWLGFDLGWLWVSPYFPVQFLVIITILRILPLVAFTLLQLFWLVSPLGRV